MQPQPGELVYDSGRKREVYIGMNVMMVRPETWEWDGVKWTPANLAMTPLYLDKWASAANSPDLHAIVMISTASSVQQSTWLYDGTSWKATNSAHVPDRGARVEYDPVHRSIVALSPLDFRTWRFAGIDWSPMPTTGITPQPRFSAAIGFDPDRGLWVVFGGTDGSVEYVDTWTGDGSTWTLHTDLTSPRARHWIEGLSYLPYDPIHHRSVLFGGISNEIYLGDTWSWDGTRWTQLAGPTYPAIPASGARLSSATPG